MKELKFPLLTKDDIEVRIGQLNKEQTKASLLLYQDARCGMKYLDLVVGVGNWQKRFYEVRGLVICSLGVNINYDEPNKEPLWVWKDDTGSAGTIEEEKSIISDSFKRCVVCFGLARELYTSPTIWVDIKSKYDKFKVLDITYNENREIETLVIGDEKGNPVYSYPKYLKVPTQAQKEPKNTNFDKGGSVSMKELNASVKSMEDYEQEYQDPFSEDSEDKKYIKEYYETLSVEGKEKFDIWLFSSVQETKIDKLNESQVVAVAKAIKNKVAKELEKKAGGN